MPSPTPATSSAFIGQAPAPPHAVSFHASWILKFTTTERALKWTHIHPLDILSTLSPPCPPRWNIALSALGEAGRKGSLIFHQHAVFTRAKEVYGYMHAQRYRPIKSRYRTIQQRKSKSKPKFSVEYYQKLREDLGRRGTIRSNHLPSTTNNVNEISEK